MEPQVPFYSQSPDHGDGPDKKASSDSSESEDEALTAFMLMRNLIAELKADVRELKAKVAMLEGRPTAGSNPLPVANNPPVARLYKPDPMEERMDTLEGRMEGLEKKLNELQVGGQPDKKIQSAKRCRECWGPWNTGKYKKYHVDVNGNRAHLVCTNEHDKDPAWERDKKMPRREKGTLL
jgi:hypothetical protein